MMEQIKFNVNDFVKVKLTETGRKILRENHDRFVSHMPESERSKFEEYNPPIDADGYYKAQLWCIMQEFGSHMIMGAALPFETNIILGEIPAEMLEPIKEDRI